MLPRYLTTLFKVSEEVIRYRLAPSQVDTLLDHLAAKIDPQHAIVYDDKIEFRYIRLHSNRKNFVIFPMSKDSANPDNEPTLRYIGDVLKDYCTKNDDQASILLIPLRQCRGYYKCPTWIDIFKRKHAVLVEVNLKENTIQIHDSQANKLWFYPDSFAERLTHINESARRNFQYNPLTDYHHYNKQIDEFSCGYFVYRYIRYILETGSSKGCENVSIQIRENYTDKQDFLTKSKISHYEYLHAEEDCIELSKENLQALFDTWSILYKEDALIPLTEWEEINDATFEMLDLSETTSVENNTEWSLLNWHGLFGDKKEVAISERALTMKVS